MKMNRIALCAVVLLAACSANASSRFSLAPKNADVIVRVSSITEATKAMENTSFGRLWKDPKFQEALGEYDFDKFMEEGILNGTNDEDEHLRIEELKMLTGEIVFAANVLKEEYTLIATISQKDYMRSQDIDRRLNEISKNKIAILKSNYQGIDIYSHKYTNAKEGTSWQAYIDNTLLMSSSEEWLKHTITQVKKSPIKTKEGETPTLKLRVNIKSIIDAFVKKAEEGIAATKKNMPASAPAAPEFSPSKIVDALGLSGLKTLTMSIKLHKDRMVSQSLLAVDKPFKGIMSMIDLTPSTINLRIPYAPEDIISYEVSRVDLMALWQQIPQMFNLALPPEIAAQANGGLMMSSAMLGVDPGRDLLAYLDSQIITAYINDKPEPKGIYFLRLKDESALQTSLQKVFAPEGALCMRIGKSFKQESFRNSSLYEFTLPGTNTTFAFTAEGGYLVLGDGKVVRQYLRAIDSNESANQAFYKSRLFGELSKRVDGKAIAYSALDLGKYVKVLLDTILENPAIAGAGAMYLSKTPGKNPFPEFDMKKLPSADYMSKFFGSSFGQVVPTPKGIKSSAVLYYGPMK